MAFREVSTRSGCCGSGWGGRLPALPHDAVRIAVWTKTARRYAGVFAQHWSAPATTMSALGPMTG